MDVITYAGIKVMIAQMVVAGVNKYAVTKDRVFLAHIISLDHSVK